MAADTAPEPTAGRNRRRPWRRLAVALSILVLAVAAAGAFLLATEAGLRTAYRAVHHLAPGLLDIGRLEGSLLGGPVIGDAVLDLPAARIRVGRLALDWRPARLLDGELRVVALEAGDIDVELRDTGPSGPLGQLPTVALPLRLVVERLALTDLAVTPAGAQEAIAVDSALLAAAWRGTGLAIETFDVAVARPAAGTASLSGELALEGRYPLVADVRWQFAAAEDLPLRGEGRLEGDLARLAVTHRTQGAVVSELSGEVSDLLDTLGWHGRLQVRDLQPRSFAPGAPAGLLGASLEGRGTLEALAIDGAIDADLDDFRALGRLQARFQAQLAGDVLDVASLELTSTATDAAVRGSGSYRVAGADPGLFEARAEWQGLGWPLGEAPQYRAPGGWLRAAGKIEDFGHEAEARIEGVDLPPADLAWRGRGNLASLTFESLRAELLEGRVEGAGELTWSPALAWSFDLAASGLQTAAQWPEFRGRLGARVRTTGSLVETLEARVVLESLDGELQDRPVAGRGAVQWRDELLTIDGLELSAGPNRLALAGTAGAVLALDAELDAPDLSVLAPGAAGEVRLEGRVTGRLERPELDGELGARALRFGETRLETAAGRVRVAADRDGVLDIDLRASGLKAGALAWDDVAVRAEGTPAAHRFSLGLDGKPLALQGGGEGTWAEDGRYGGTLQSFAVDSAQAGGWRLRGPAAFNLGAGAWAVQRLCLDSTGNLGGGCVAAEGGGARWKVDAEVPRLDLAAFAPLVPAGIVVEGHLGASARLAAEGNLLSGEARVEVPSGTSRVDLEEQDQVLDFAGASLRVTAAGGDLAADLDLPFAGLGQVRSDARLPGWRLDAPARPEQPVRATLKGRIPDLAPLNAVVPQVADLRGAVDADLRLEGTLGGVRVDGSVTVADTGFDVPAAGVQVSELSLQARSRTLDVLEYSGRARLGNGVIDLGGETRRTRDRGMLTEFRIEGQKLTVVDVPQATVVVSPDLTFTIDREVARLTGEVVVPEARLRPRGIPEGSVAPSDDVVIKGRDDGEGNLKLLTAADVRLRLGDRVSFEGFGLRCLFRGDLRVTQEPGRLALGNGQLRIQDGTFATFGEDLTIEQGRLVFANTPVYNPGISIVASREFTEAKVGARVAGTLKKPQVTFFADPPMGQAEALNYLLTGGASSRGSATSGAAVVGGNLLVKEVGRQIGLDDIGVRQEADSDDLSLYIGTYLTPRLYMQYVSEMGDRANSVRMRYDLTKRIQVEGETGDVQSVDVFYTIER